MDLDLELWIDWPLTLMDDNSFNDMRDLGKWDNSNRMSLMIVNYAIPKSFKGYKFLQSHTLDNFLDKNCTIL